MIDNTHQPAEILILGKTFTVPTAGSYSPFLLYTNQGHDAIALDRLIIQAPASNHETSLAVFPSGAVVNASNLAKYLMYRDSFGDLNLYVMPLAGMELRSRSSIIVTAKESTTRFSLLGRVYREDGGVLDLR